MTEETLGRQIARAREEHTLSQSELADAMQVAKYTIHRWEHDLALPRTYAQRWLIEHLGVSKTAFEQAKQARNLRPDLSREKEKEISLDKVQGVVKGLKVYHGWREIINDYGKPVWVPMVEVDGRSLPAFEAQWNQYEWGYLGTGPSNLAVSILADYFEEKTDASDRYKDHQARRYAPAFRDEVISRLPHENTDEWWITSVDIAQWLRKRENKENEEGYFL